jgi:hypothetical protein
MEGPAMSHRLFPALAAAAALLACAGAARAADAPKPLRVLVYDVAYSTTTVRREHTSGFSNSGSGIGTGSGAVDRRFGSDDRGTLTVAVIAATADGGLVADASFVGKSMTQPVIRVAIAKDGSLSYDPKTQLSGQALGLLPFLARGLIAEREVNPGSTWSVSAPAPAAGTTTYRVTAVDGGKRATLELDSSITMKGGSAFTQASQGKTVYATDLLSPVSVDLHTVIRRDLSIDLADTTDARLSASMVSDTFAKR